MGTADDVRGRILAGLPHARAVALRGGCWDRAWGVVADAEAYLRGSPTFIPPEAIADALEPYLPSPEPR